MSRRHKGDATARTRARAMSAWSVAIALATAGGAHSGLAQGGVPARQWAAEAARDLDLQTELPRRAEDPAPVSLKVPKELLWVAVLGGLAVFAFYAGGLLPFRGAAGRPDWEAGDGDPGGAGAPPSGDDAAAAEALARTGRFAEAMHLTLLGSVAAVRERLGAEIADSLTSREILRSRHLPESGRGYLREIVGRVERSHFGRYPASGEDYAACRDAFAGLLQALRRERTA